MILRPIDQLGCFRASATDTWGSFSTGQSRKAPPDAVSKIRRSPSLGYSLQALEDGRMFRIGGEQLHTMLFHQGQHGRATGNQSLFVSQGDVFTRFNGRQGGQQPGTADDPRDYRFGIAISGRLLPHPSSPARILGHGIQTRQGCSQVSQLCLVTDGNNFGLKLPDLLSQKLYIVARRNAPPGEIGRGLFSRISRVWVPIEPVDPSRVMAFTGVLSGRCATSLESHVMPLNQKICVFIVFDDCIPMYDLKKIKILLI